MVRITWTHQSVKDLENIYEYISKDSVKYARIQIIRIRDRVKILKSHPEAGRVVPETAEASIREIISGSFRIIYRIKEDKLIEIITIHHSARLLKPIK